MVKQKGSLANKLLDDPHIPVPLRFIKTKRGKKISSKAQRVWSQKNLSFLLILVTVIFGISFSNFKNLDQLTFSSSSTKSISAKTLANKNQQSVRMIDYQIEAASLGQSFQSPFSTTYLSQEFSRFHPAIDIIADYGDQVFPIAAGTITYVGWDSYGKGKVVIIAHNDDIFSVYAHLAKINVVIEDYVSKDTSIGKVGTTGYSTGAHLHLEIIDQDKLINPKNIIPI